MSNIEKYEFKIFICIFVYMMISLLIIKNNKLKNISFVSKEKQAIDNINKLVKNNYKSNNHTIHINNEDLPIDIQKEIQIINKEILNKLGNKFKYFPSITELYYSSKKDSDIQFTSVHMDGPFYACNVYRALIAINGNQSIFTNYTDNNTKINLKKYDILLFDYNREPHNIEIDTKIKDDSQRIIIKMNYVEKSDYNLCEKYLCKYNRLTRNILNKNKKKKIINRPIDLISLNYYTNRKYIIILLGMGIYAYYKNYNNMRFGKTKYLIYLICLIEIGIVFFIFSHHFMKFKQCSY
jgi:hypothetical protein